MLVRERFAACASILPGASSVYEWKGKIEIEEEFLLLIKSRADKFAGLEGAIRARHPYELPEIVAVPIEDGLGPYLSWIDSVLDKEKE